MPSHILIIDDEANIRRMLAALLRAEGFSVEEAGNGPAGLIALERLEPDAIFMDFLMPPGPDGLETLRQIRTRGIQTPVVMMSGKAQLADAVRAAQLGAFQFLEKPLSPETVLVTLQAALELARTRNQNRALLRALAPREEMVGTSDALQRVRLLVAQVAPTDARVLISGESGTGKELVAAAIHRASQRAGEPFITVNCAAIPRELVESEMFGHERGAFTGALERRLGRFELADGGTLFLDEIGDLNLEAQAKLLRTLETGILQRLGAEQPTHVNVRVVTATNHRLELAVQSGGFREDLYFRLNIFPIQLPPLRERLTDLPALVAHLAERARPGRGQRYSPAALERLAAYPWPGNIRELANLVERLAILGGEEIGEADVATVLPEGRPRAPGLGRSAGPGSGHNGQALTEALDGYERELISHALDQAQGNIAEAARALQTDRANLYRRMKRLGLVRAEAPGD